MNRLLTISTLIILTACGRATQPDISSQTDHITKPSSEIETTTTDYKSDKEEKSESVDCNDFVFNSPEVQADSILLFMDKASGSSSTNRQEWEHKFFCAFPSSFDAMQAVFGYDDKNGAAPLYSTDNPTFNYMDKRIYSDVIGYFSELRSIPDSVYYTKYIRININGRWEADNIGEAFGFQYRLMSDTEAVCKALANFSDQEISSVFRFIFDGPHPKNEHNENIFETLKSKIEAQNERLENLLYQAYVTVMAEEDHGY